MLIWIRAVIDIVSSLNIWDEIVSLAGLVTAIIAVYMTKRSIDLQNAQSMFKMRADICRIVIGAVENFENVKDRISINQSSFKDTKVPGILEFTGHISMVTFEDGLLHREELASHENRELVMGYVKELRSTVAQMDLLFYGTFVNEVVDFLNAYAELITILYDYELALCKQMQYIENSYRIERVASDFLRLKKVYEDANETYNKFEKREVLSELRDETRLIH